MAGPSYLSEIVRGTLSTETSLVILIDLGLSHALFKLVGSTMRRHTQSLIGQMLLRSP